MERQNSGRQRNLTAALLYVHWYFTAVRQQIAVRISFVPGGRDMPLDGLERLVAYVVFDLASVVGCGFPVDAESHQAFCKSRMPLVYFFCYSAAGTGQRKMTFLINNDVAGVFQQADCSADAWLGKSHMIADIHRSYMISFL